MQWLSFIGSVRHFPNSPAWLARDSTGPIRHDYTVISNDAESETEKQRRRILIGTEGNGEERENGSVKEMTDCILEGTRFQFRKR